jgi:hypothetical protein
MLHQQDNSGSNGESVAFDPIQSNSVAASIRRTRIMAGHSSPILPRAMAKLVKQTGSAGSTNLSSFFVFSP